MLKGRALASFLTGAVIASLLLGTSGCSHVFMKPAPPKSSWNLESSKIRRCTESKVLPAVDTVIGGLQVFRGINGENRGDRIGAAIGATIFFASAIKGFINAERCSEFKAFQLSGLSEENE